jgi:hypothetical protein
VINHRQTVLAQYQNSPKLLANIDYFNAWIRPDVNIDDFYNYCFNVLTAKGFGLDDWGKIVNIARQIEIPGTNVDFGFEEALPGSYGFGQAPFYNSVQATTTFTLPDDSYRTLILTKALINICSFTAQSVNALLSYLFAGRGNCYVEDLGGMAIKYFFGFPLLVWEVSILQSSFLPRPAGVLATYEVLTVAGPFGFQEAGYPPFGFGNFYHF